MDHWSHIGKRFIMLIWDKAYWHTSKRIQDWIRTYDRRAKQESLSRLIACQLPTRSPWLMPQESIFGWAKHHALGNHLFEIVAELQAAVELYFHQWVAQARERRDRAWAKALAVAT